MSGIESSHTADAIRESIERSIRSGGWRTYRGEMLDALCEWHRNELSCDHVRLCSSGTIAVELSLRSLQLKPGDEVLLSGYDFPGNFRAIHDAGGRVVLCDPAAPDWTLSCTRLEQSVAPECRAVIVSHLHGQLAPMPQIMDWALERNIIVVEDACQAQGAFISGKQAGTWGHLGVFSLGGSKLVSAGRGGVVVTKDPLLAQRMTVYCERGNDAFALSEIQAALALPQCKRLRQDHELRLQAAGQLREQLSRYPWLSLPPLPDDGSPAYYKFGVCLVDTTSRPGLRDQIVQRLVQLGIDAGVGFPGFARRSPKRFRSVHALSQTDHLANHMILLHHSLLLDPCDATQRVEDVAHAFKLVDQEYFG